MIIDIKDLPIGTRVRINKVIGTYTPRDDIFVGREGTTVYIKDLGSPGINFGEKVNRNDEATGGDEQWAFTTLDIDNLTDPDGNY